MHTKTWSALAALVSTTAVMLLSAGSLGAAATAAPVSEATEACLECHAEATPGIVADWRKSRHARVSPSMALKQPAPERRMSAAEVPEALRDTAVGCAECHTLRGDAHADTFEHGDHEIHIVVSPKDCAVCHPEEEEQYGHNIMSEAYGNLMGNPVFQGLFHSVNGTQRFEDGALVQDETDPMTANDACLSCHGTRIEVKGTVTRDTDLAGEMDFPVLVGWPNQGVGRINPDGSKGACTACHTRHEFSIEMARKPATCSQCHKGPDVPASKVYAVSKHGNIYSAMGDHWNFDDVPWTVGEDFTAPTCAACHVSLLVKPDGTTVAERTHRMNDRLDSRLFGLIYAHSHPKEPSTTGIRNAAGLPLPTELTGEEASAFLIGPDEKAARRARMKGVCKPCHATGWVDGHFEKLDHTIKTTNLATRAATDILLAAWTKGVAKGLPQGASIFDEAIEKMWVEQWLFYANSTRFASAMGGADYGVFANGRWYLQKNLRQMADWLKFLVGAK